MACVHLGYPKDVTLEWNEDEETFFVSTQERCIFDFEYADKEIDFSFSVPPSDGQSLERTDYIMIGRQGDITLTLEEGEQVFLVKNREDFPSFIKSLFESIGCQVTVIPATPPVAIPPA